MKKRQENENSKAKTKIKCRVEEVSQIYKYYNTYISAANDIAKKNKKNVIHTK